MDNLRIGKKLSLCFALLLVVLLAIGGIGIYNEGKLNDAAQVIGVDRKARLEASVSVANAVSDVRIAEATHVLTPDPTVEAQMEQELTRLRTSIDRQLAAMDKMYTLPAVREELGKLTGAWQEYQSAFD